MALTKINTKLIANNTIALTNIADNAVDATKIASNSILTRHIDDDQITADQIVDDIALAGNISTTGNFGVGAAPTNGGISTAASPVLSISGTVPELNFVDTSSSANDYWIRVSDGLQFGEASDSRMYLKNGGNLGIGTTSPATKLHIEESTAGADISFRMRALNDSSAGRTVNFTFDPDARSLAIGESGELVVKEGDVGIGTSSPDCTLHINGSANSEQVIITGNGNASRGLSISTAANAGQQDAHVIFNAQDTGHADYPMITFQTGGTERMRIQPAGHVNIGIGGSGGDLILQPLAKLYLDAGGNTYIQESAGDVIDFYAGGARKLRINSNGLIFNTDTAAANALNDYEEGTFTPSWTVAGGGSVSGVTSTNVGTYTKIGNMVYVTVRSHYVQTTGTVPTSYSMTLPFQAKNTGGMAGSGIGSEIGQTGKSMFVNVDGNGSTCTVKAENGTAPPANAYMDLFFSYVAG